MRLEELDHVAIAVADPEASAAWYVEVLGLERRHDDIWGGFPVFVCAGRSGLAIFPRKEPSGARLHGGTEVRHIAFRTDGPGLAKARAELSERGIAVVFQDHEIAHSIYFEDPDGFQLEITTYDLEGSRPG